VLSRRRAILPIETGEAQPGASGGLRRPLRLMHSAPAASALVSSPMSKPRSLSWIRAPPASGRLAAFRDGEFGQSLHSVG
jgi:hypothetical protein